METIRQRGRLKKKLLKEPWLTDHGMERSSIMIDQGKKYLWNAESNDARKDCSFVLTSFTGWSSERSPGIGFLSRGDREIGVLRNVEPPTRPRLECLRETGLILRCDRKVGNPFQTKQGSRPS